MPCPISEGCASSFSSVARSAEKYGPWQLRRTHAIMPFMKAHIIDWSIVPLVELMRRIGARLREDEVNHYPAYTIIEQLLLDREWPGSFSYFHHCDTGAMFGTGFFKLGDDLVNLHGKSLYECIFERRGDVTRIGDWEQSNPSTNKGRGFRMKVIEQHPGLARYLAGILDGTVADYTASTVSENTAEVARKGIQAPRL